MRQADTGAQSAAGDPPSAAAARDRFAIVRVCLLRQAHLPASSGLTVLAALRRLDARSGSSMYRLNPTGTQEFINTRVFSAVAALSSSFFLVDLIALRSGWILDVDARAHAAVYGVFRASVPASWLPTVQAFVLVDVSSLHLRLLFLGISLLFLCVVARLVAEARIWTSAFVILALSGAVLFPILVKRVVVRPTPYLPDTLGHTFPSGNACGAFTLSVVVLFWAWYRGSRKTTCIVVGVLSGWYTLLLGLASLKYHYPSEIVGGYALSLAWLSFLFILGRRHLDLERRARPNVSLYARYGNARAASSHGCMRPFHFAARAQSGERRWETRPRNRKSSD